MIDGIVKWFNARTGLGVVVPSTEPATDFVVLSESIGEPYRALEPGEAVAFELDPARPHVVRLVLVREPQPAAHAPHDGGRGPVPG